MAIAIDTSLNWPAPNSSGTNTLSYTMGSVTNGILIAGVNTPGTITSCTYNGVAMTKLADGTTGFTYFYLQNPASGAHNLVLTRSGTNTSSLDGWAISFSGVQQTGNPFSGLQSNAGSGATGFSNNYTTTVANAYVIDFLEADGSPSHMPVPITATGTGHISAQYSYTGGGTQEGGGVGYTPTTTTGSYPIGYSWGSISPAGNWTVDYYQLNQPSTAGTLTNVSTMTNVSTLTF